MIRHICGHNKHLIVPSCLFQNLLFLAYITHNICHPYTEVTNDSRSSGPQSDF